MGIFDFLHGGLQPQDGGSMDGVMAASPSINQAMAPQMGGQSTAQIGGVDVGPLKQPPVMAERPGLLDRITAPDPNTGTTFRDKLMMAGALMRDNGDPSTVVEMQNARLKQMEFQRQLAIQVRGNQAFRAAYQNGRFDPSTYAQVMGNYLDPRAMAEIAKTVNPEQSLQDSYIVEKDPIKGTARIVGQRPQTYSETETQQQNVFSRGLDTAKFRDQVRHEGVQEGQDAQKIGIEGYTANTGRMQAGTAADHLTLDRVEAARARNPGVPVAMSPADLQSLRLAPGAVFIGPDGQVRHAQ